MREWVNDARAVGFGGRTIGAGYEGETDDAGLQPEGATGEAGSRREEGGQEAEAVREVVP